MQSRVHGPPALRLTYHSMRQEVARNALLATQGGLRLELCAVLYHISPMALCRLVCALDQPSLVRVLVRCGLPLPIYFLADEKHSHCLTDPVYLPTIVHGRVIWHLGYTEHASAAALTRSYGEFQRAATLSSGSYSRCKGSIIPVAASRRFSRGSRTCTTSSRISVGPGTLASVAWKWKADAYPPEISSSMSKSLPREAFDE